MQTLVLSVFLPCLVVSFPPRHSDPFNPLGAWHRRSKPCGIPKFINDLPTEAAEKITKIWEKYIEGNTCEKEHEETRNVIRGLTTEERDKVFAGRCGPSFLKNVSATVREEFKNVWFDYKLSVEEKELALQKLAYSLLTGESLALFNKWEEELKTRKVEVARRLSELSPEARKAFEQWKELRLNEKKFLAGLSKEIRDELKKMFISSKRVNATTTTTTTSTTTTTETPTTPVGVSSTTEPVTPTTTTAAAIAEETKEKEFSSFLYSQTPEELNTEDQCSFYA